MFDIPQPLGMSSFLAQQRVGPVAMRILEIAGALLDADVTPVGQNGTVDLGGLDVGQMLGKVAPLVSRALETLPAGELGAVTKILLADTKVLGIPGAPQGIPLFSANGTGDYFDDVMRGRALDTWFLLWKAVQIWYPDFLGLAERFRAQKTRAANLSGESASTT